MVTKIKCSHFHWSSTSGAFGSQKLTLMCELLTIAGISEETIVKFIDGRK